MTGAVADHGDINEGLVMAWVALMIAHQTPGFDKPAKGALHHPAPGQHHEALCRIAALDGAQSESCRVSEHPARRMAVLHAGRRDLHAQEIAQRVGEDVALATLDLLPAS